MQMNEIRKSLLDLAEKVEQMQKFQIKAEIIRIMNLIQSLK
tara:strand:- start:159 stop:281 length:123 start_codon:yes stop_codon:yes gene_type:complete